MQVRLFALFQCPAEGEGGKRADRAGQQVDADEGEAEAAGQAQRHQRREAGADQPGEIGGQAAPV